MSFLGLLLLLDGFRTGFIAERIKDLGEGFRLLGCPSCGGCNWLCLLNFLLLGRDVLLIRSFL
jgi:hypothetical protein